MQDPYRLDDYLKYNIFLADINNEKEVKSDIYRDNMLSLRHLVLVRFADDVTVVPRDSAIFGFYDGKELLQMEQTALYQVCRFILVKFCGLVAERQLWYMHAWQCSKVLRAVLLSIIHSYILACLLYLR